MQGLYPNACAQTADSEEYPPQPIRKVYLFAEEYRRICSYQTVRLHLLHPHIQIDPDGETGGLFDIFVYFA